MGRGVEGAGIWFTSSRGGWRSGYPTTRSEADGTFVNEDLPEGEWELVVWDVLGVDSGSLHLSEEVRAVSGAEDVLLVVDLGDRAEGRLVAELVDADSGVPLDALSAGLHLPDREPGRKVPQARISAGRVAAEKLEPGRYQLWVRIQDHALAMTSFEIAAGGSEVHLRVPVGRPGGLRGTIVPNEGRDLSSARLVAVFLTEIGPMDPRRLHPGLSPQLGIGSADESGNFALQDLSPGRWRIEARWRDEVSESVEVEVFSHQESEARLTLRPAATLVVAFGDWPGDRYGEITLRREGEPVQRHANMLVEGGPRELELVLRPGRVEYEVTLTDFEGTEAVTGTVELKAGEVSRIDCEW